jgi:hypothetical protein
MLERIHQHILDELNQGSRTDTIFVVVAVVFNVVVLGINSAAAGSAAAIATYGAGSLVADMVMFVFVLMTLIVNAVAVGALSVGSRTRQKLLDGLLSVYTDNQVDRYYDRSLVSNYRTRYALFGMVIMALAATSILVPLVIRLL